MDRRQVGAAVLAVATTALVAGAASVESLKAVLIAAGIFGILIGLTLSNTPGLLIEARGRAMREPYSKSEVVIHTPDLEVKTNSRLQLEFWLELGGGRIIDKSRYRIEWRKDKFARFYVDNPKVFSEGETFMRLAFIAPNAEVPARLRYSAMRLCFKRTSGLFKYKGSLPMPGKYPDYSSVRLK